MTPNEINDFLKITARAGETVERAISSGSSQFKDEEAETKVELLLAAKSGLADFVSKVWPSITDLWVIDSAAGQDIVFLYECDGKSVLFNLGNKCRKVIC